MKTIFKYTIVMLMLMHITKIEAQDKRFTFSVYTEPQHYSTDIWNEADGFNIGLAIEYQMTIMYLKAQTFIFPDLNGATYFDFQATLIGFNHHSKRDNYRIFAGGKAGLIKRESYTYPVVGLEYGFEYYFDNTFFIGLQASNDYRTDDKYWDSSASGYMSFNAGLKFGFQF
ncbi:hypothetical protein ES692_06030 [Psychroserpens burtonensis]|uniref:Porin family protein n=1 Tax=Psychroserpens burtonensis TaxID=49278 RepID=A0A5C7BDD8_9FLAO|nr:hypothetical protein [Psychroserpens burtonensis]TXE18599.1 hypothetical protein ES692_06030 [Psychroserpens burtonensis]